MPWMTLLVVLAGIFLAAPRSQAEDPPPFRIVLPSGEAHELLPKTCGVCHKDTPYQFFVIAAPDQKGLEKALDALRGKTEPQPEPAERPQNLHAATACPFCHLDTPQPGEDPSGMQFRTLNGEATTVDRIERLCDLCHPKGQNQHPRVVGRSDPSEDLRAAGLPVRLGKVGCATCHDMHSQEVGPADVRKPYVEFAATSPASYPHSNRAACRACHPRDLPAGSPAVFQESDPTKLCVGCHSEDHTKIHPVGVAPSEKTYPMSFLQYPLNPDGTIGCSTCHDHPCDPTKPPTGPSFLRGGPYITFTDFCYRCHPKAGKGGLNPHDQVDSKGNVISGTCTFCHKTAPTGDAYDPSELLYLRSPIELCTRCHDQGPHPSANHLVEVPQEMAKKLEAYEKRHKVLLPLDDAGRIVCTTCHNPHAKGVLRGEAALGAGELHRWRVPSYAELCTPCHTRYD